MLIPAAISLIISSLFLNFNLLVKSPPLTLAKNPSSEVRNEARSFNKVLAYAIEGVKALPGEGFLKKPAVEQPAGQLPKAREKTIDSEAANINLPTENAAILDCQNDDLYFAKRPDRTWPIASITKLFTAYTFLDYNPGWETSVEIQPADKREGGKIYLFKGDKVKVKDLFYFSLVGSDNTATAALVRSTGLSEADFVVKINDKLKELGLKNTRIVDPVGLQDGNISTAREVAVFAKIALANPDISRASLTEKYEFYTEQGRKKSIASTNELLRIFPAEGISILGGKTGHVNSSGYCLVSQFKDYSGQTIVTVILGADSENSRFSLTKKLVDLYYKNQP
jgi:serine-type D-Ala-D-Ala endopeptidase (penicillin-binding protein 7)